MSIEEKTIARVVCMCTSLAASVRLFVLHTGKICSLRGGGKKIGTSFV